MIFKNMTKFKLVAAFLVTVVSPAVPAAAQQAESPDLLFVMDASNSMWGQIDGVSKSEIARSAFRELVADLPDDTRAGVMAYGHRRKADCGDVETLVPVSALNRETLIESVEALKPRGKTPITESLRAAADLLSKSGGATRLVLISDGIETCGGDPCELAATLAGSGIDLKAHVIGFDIPSKADQAKLACIAHLTGGTYWNARDAEGLTGALKETVAAEAGEPQTISVELVAADKLTGQHLQDPVSWIVSRVEDETVVSSGLFGGTVEVQLAPGRYSVTATLSEKSGRAAFDVGTGGTSQTVFLDGTLPVAAIMPEVAEAQATSTIKVAFEGPNDEADFLRLVTPDGNRLEQDIWVSVREGSPALLPLPGDAGDYRIVYVWAEGAERVLAEAAIKVLPAKVALTFKPEVSMGELVEVNWQGPGGAEDWIGIVPTGGFESDIDGRWERISNGSPLAIQAPAEAGAFEVIYVAGIDQSILARSPLSVVEAVARLEAAEMVEATAMLSVGWSGPEGPDDWIGIAEPGSAADAFVTYERPSEGKVALVSPLTPGPYELRYVLSAADGAKVLASQPITVVEPAIVLEAPGEVAAGTMIYVNTSGPANGSNFVGFAEPEQDAWGTASGSWESADNIKDGKVDVPAPETAGTYELRFVLTSGDASVAARQTVIVK